MSVTVSHEIYLKVKRLELEDVPFGHPLFDALSRGMVKVYSDKVWLRPLTITPVSATIYSVKIETLDF